MNTTVIPKGFEREIELLREAGFRDIATHLYFAGGKCMVDELSFYVPPILRDDKQREVERLVGDDYHVVYFPNTMNMHVKRNANGTNHK